METGGTAGRYCYGHICEGEAICISLTGKPARAMRQSLRLERRGDLVARHFPFVSGTSGPDLTPPKVDSLEVGLTH